MGYVMSEVKRVNIDFSGLQGPAKCGQCGSTTTDICNQNGCGFLESGNGESELDAQRLRADTAEAERDAAVETISELSDKVVAAEQRIAEHEGMLRHFANCAEVFQVGTAAMDYVAALNPAPEAGSHE